MRRRTAATGAVVIVAVVAIVWSRRAPSVPAEPTAVPAPSPEQALPAAPAPARAPASSGSVPAPAKAARAPTFLPKDERQRLFLAERDETRRTLISKYRYPPGSQALATRTDMLMPHHVEPVLRGLGGNGDGKLSVEQNQSRVYLQPGQSAVATIKILYSGQPTSVTFTSSDLSREASGTTPATKLGTITFRDDGADPDAIAGDGVYTANVAPPAGTPPEGLQLMVNLSSNGEQGQLFFPFVQTGAAPAQFTQQIRVALEDGSVAFYVGVDVTTAGMFEILGRVYDAPGTPVVLCRFHDALAVGAQEVRMVAYGKLLLDEGAVPPLTLRDLEGWSFALGQYPDRNLMDDWAGGFTTPAYDIHQFTSQDWNGGDLQSQLQALDQSTADGLANLQSQRGP